MVVAGAILLLVVALLLLIYLCAEVKAERRARIAKQEASKNGKPNSSAALDAATLFGIVATHEYLRKTTDSDDDSWNDSSSYDSDYDYDAQEDYDDYDEFDDDMSWINGTY